MLYLTDGQWYSRIKTIATKRLHKYGKALAAISMLHYFRLRCVVEYQRSPNGPVIVVDEGKYKATRELFMNNSDDELKKLGVIA